MSSPERPSFASSCDLDELKHQVREKAIAELKEYIEKDGDWLVSEWTRALKSVPQPAVFLINKDTYRSITQDAEVFSFQYKDKCIYKVVRVSSVDVDVQRKRKIAEKEHTKRRKAAAPADLMRLTQRVFYDETDLPDATHEDAHSEWFVGLWDELHKKVVQAKECAEWEALLHDKPKKEEARGFIVEYPAPKAPEVDTPMWVILGGLCLLAIIIGAILL
jgi:hypothetical protein